MRCLKCWKDIEGEVAIFTKSCQHVFCEPCSERAFKKELSCPLCDTVLAKDGISQIMLRPDDIQLRKLSTKLFGLEPKKLCDVLQLGLDFWAKQKENESVQHMHHVKEIKKELGEAEMANQKLSKALEDERLKKKSLQSENKALQRHIGELETRYAEKARSMRKLSELYSELRQVHRRLEADLRGVRDTADYDATENIRQSGVEVGGLGEVTKRTTSQVVEERRERRHSKARSGSVEESGEICFSGRGQYEMQDRVGRGKSCGRRTSGGRHSEALNTLFELAPKQDVREFDLKRRNSDGTGRIRRRLGRHEWDGEKNNSGRDYANDYESKTTRTERRG